MHSSAYGDYVVLYREPGGEILRQDSPEELRQQLRDYRRQGIEGVMILHHIGYPKGFCGIDWDSFSEELSPVIEVISKHGVAESDDAPLPYLHIMGPRDYRSTIKAGLMDGHIFGLVGSTYHHSAFPGSYGGGKVGVWAKALTRESIWEALCSRRVFAVTGDPVSMTFSENQAVMGEVTPWEFEHTISYVVEAGNAIDYVEVLYRNQVIHRESVFAPVETNYSEIIKIDLELGWGKKNEYIDWECEIEVVDGALHDVTAHFRRPDFLSPLAKKPERPLECTIELTGKDKIRL